MHNFPAPLVAADCDCTDLDGFMLNVERLMASELVALSTHEVVGAALFLWCRAWKQRPAASLPDDDRVLAAYARLPMPRFRRLKDEVTRGFVKCSDGRLYHPVLAAEATKAYEKKKAFRTKRETDAGRLRKWRESQRGNDNETPPETHSETPDETRFVAEGQGQGQVSYSEANASGDANVAGVVFDQGRIWLQRSTGKPEPTCRALLGKWRKSVGDEGLVAILGQAQRHGPIDAIAWIEGALKQRRDLAKPSGGFNG